MCVCGRVCISLTTYACRKKFSGDWFNGKVLSRSIDGLATDAKPRYKIKYEDDDEEELYVEEILPLLKVRAPLHGCPEHLTFSSATSPPLTHAFMHMSGSCFS